jgi:predicted deacylase
MKKPAKRAAAPKPKRKPTQTKVVRPKVARTMKTAQPKAATRGAARPASMKPIRIGTLSLTGPGSAKGMLKTAELPDGYPIEIPVLAVRGREAGPTIWLNGCVHGNEYCGAYILHSFMRSLDPETLKGTAIALPVLSLSGFLRHQRMSPFEGFHGGDLNRCFPGNPEGTHTEQIAYQIYRHLKEHADYLVDMHTAVTPDTRWSLFAPPSGPVGRKAEAMSRAFGYPHTLPTPLNILGGSSLIVSAKAGIPGLIVEAGGFEAGFDAETVADGAERLRNVLRRIGMLPGAVTDYGKMTHFSNFAWVKSSRGGLFKPAVKCGERLKKGQVVGRYYDVFGDLLEEMKSPNPGIVLAVNGGPVITNGDIVVHIGLDPRAV